MKYSASDVRFTISKDGKTLYVFFLGKPRSGEILSVKHVLDNGEKKIKNVSLLANKAKVKFKVKGTMIQIVAPSANEMNDIATVFKIEYQ